MIGLLEYRRAGPLGSPGSSANRTVAAPAWGRPATPSEPAPRPPAWPAGLDRPALRPPQLPEEALDRIQFGGIGWLHHRGVSTACIAFPVWLPAPFQTQPSMPGSCTQSPQMRAIFSPFIFF